MINTCAGALYDAMYHTPSHVTIIELAKEFARRSDCTIRLREADAAASNDRFIAFEASTQIPATEGI